MSGENYELISHSDAFAFFMERYKEIIESKSMVSAVKSYIILHRFLRYNKQYENTNSTEIACYSISTTAFSPYCPEAGKNAFYEKLLSFYLDYLKKYADYNSQIKFINSSSNSEAFEAVSNLLISEIFTSFEIISVLLKKIEALLEFYGFTLN